MNPEIAIIIAKLLGKIIEILLTCFIERLFRRLFTEENKNNRPRSLFVAVTFITIAKEG